MLPSSLYIQQLKERLGVNSCNTLTKLFYPSQLTGQYKHPTALSATEWTISNMNTFETSKTDWNTSVAAQIYRGDPWTGTAQCLLASGGTTSSVATTASPSSTSQSTSTTSGGGSSKSHTTTIVLAVVIPIVALLIIGAIIAIFLVRRRRSNN